MAKISFIGTICEKKNILGSVTDLKAEALVMQEVSCDKCFPFLFGVMKPGELLVEYISGGFTLGTTQPPRTLRSVYETVYQLKPRHGFPYIGNL